MSHNLRYRGVNLSELEFEFRDTIERIKLLQDEIDSIRISLINDNERINLMRQKILSTDEERVISTDDIYAI